MGLLGKQQQEHLAKRKTIASSQAGLNLATGRRKKHLVLVRVAIWMASCTEIKKHFTVAIAYLTINEYTETEVAWVRKAPVPYEIIHSSFLLVPLCCCCFSSSFISVRDWVWVRRRGMSPWLPHGPKADGEKGKGKTAEPVETPPSSLLFDS